METRHERAAPSPVGFDAAAERYDDDERENAVLAHMRARAFEQLCAAFAPGGVAVMNQRLGDGAKQVAA